MTLVKMPSEGIKKENSLVVDLEKLNKRKGYWIVKRCIDCIGALCGILLLFPVFLIVSLMIKYEDPKGPVLFKQIRVGRNGKEFNMYKFRSMVTDAEERLNDILKYNEVSGAMFKMKEDPRVTKIGKFIRKTSLDELPQLINVLKGEMSLVGPRPPLVREVREYDSYDMQRLMIVPGCTGLWQVSGRSSLSFKDMVELDITYINKMSFLFDLIIIFKTFNVIMGDKDVY
ncbi:sugar transferase [Bacillus sp. KbaL1]|uniref:sugar transferase n=1 Tax=Bacillus sp. KbaL1 TaxID=1978340 RepID=UPI000B7FF360|nr:sugar transferase [Bacillus sp. KbaL1]OXL97436.1 multidrug MFS transporter [Bacillus sp. KbaL1]